MSKSGKECYVDVDIHKAGNAAVQSRLDTLPPSCAQSADRLEQLADAFTARGVFPASLIEATAAKLRSYDGEEAAKALHDPETMARLVKEYFYCG